MKQISSFYPLSKLSRYASWKSADSIPSSSPKTPPDASLSLSTSDLTMSVDQTDQKQLDTKTHSDETENTELTTATSLTVEEDMGEEDEDSAEGTDKGFSQV